MTPIREAFVHGSSAFRGSVPPTGGKSVIRQLRKPKSRSLSATSKSHRSSVTQWRGCPSNSGCSSGSARWKDSPTKSWPPFSIFRLAPCVRGCSRLGKRCAESGTKAYPKRRFHVTCDEAAEYVSALCDGVAVPRTAAEHIDVCESCRERLNDYVQFGAELRRAASLEIAETPTPYAWPERGKGPILWQRAWKTIRIPRVAFASLVAAIVVLGSGWALTGVRADTRGSVLLVQYTIGDNSPSF